MSTHLQQYESIAAPFAAVVAATDDWAAASPCEGWTAADVLAHVIGTQRDFLAARGVELPAATDAASPSQAWRDQDALVRGLLADEGVATAAYEGYFGPTTLGDTLVQFYGFDLLVHRWDLARSQGRDERFEASELDTLEGAVAGFGEQLYAEGICKPALQPPADADRQEQLLAKLGRAVR